MSAGRVHGRREALGLLAALLATGVAGGLAGCNWRANRDVLVATRGDRDAAKAIGEAWLDQNDEVPKSADELAARFMGDASLADYKDKPNELRAMLYERIREDFAEGRTARLGGWLMSTTELDVYAYVAVLVY